MRNMLKLLTQQQQQKQQYIAKKQTANNVEMIDLI